MIYYKATRPDGTDFYSGIVKYEVGKRTVHPSTERRTRNDASTYLSVSTVPTDCTGFKWPCRLFAVKGVGRAMGSDELPNKRAFIAVDVVEELPAHEVFGPQSEQVVALIERAKKLTASEVNQVYAAWYAARGAARDDAWHVAGLAAWYAARDAAWYAARDAAWDVAGYAPGYAARGLVVRDLIRQHGFTQAHYDILTGPWRKVIGPVHPDDVGSHRRGGVSDE